jgi:hypothetical protein
MAAAENGPWEDYPQQTATESGPWDDYKQENIATPAPVKPAATLFDRISTALQKPTEEFETTAKKAWKNVTDGTQEDADRAKAFSKLSPAQAAVANTLHTIQQNKQDMETLVASPIKFAMNTLAAGAHALFTQENVLESQKKVDEYTQNILATNPSESLHTAMSLISQGIDVFGAEVGTVAAEFKRLYNKDMTLDDYQKIVKEGQWATQASTIAVPTIKGSLATASFIRDATKAGAETLKAGKRVKVDEGQEAPETTFVEKAPPQPVTPAEVDGHVKAAREAAARKAAARKAAREDAREDAARKAANAPKQDETFEQKDQNVIDEQPEVDGYVKAAREDAARKATNAPKQDKTFEQKNQDVIDEQLKSSMDEKLAVTAKLNQEKIDTAKTDEQQHAEEEAAYQAKQKQIDQAWNEHKTAQAEQEARMTKGDAYDETPIPKSRPKAFRGPGARQAGAIDLQAIKEGVQSLADTLRKFRTPEEVKASVGEIADALHRMQTSTVAAESLAIEREKAAAAAGVTDEMGRKFTSATEESTPLTREEFPLYKKFFIPAVDRLAQKMKEYASLAGKDFDYDKGIVPRYAIGKGGFIDRLLELSERGISQALGVSRTPSIARARSYHSVDHPDGSTSIISIGDPNPRWKTRPIIQWTNGVPSVIGRVSSAEAAKVKPGMVLKVGANEVGEVRLSTQTEAETHTDTKYLPNGLSATIRKEQELDQAISAIKTIKAITTNPAYSHIIQDTRKMSEAEVNDLKASGWRQPSEAVREVIPELNGKYMDANVAEALEDFLEPKRYGTGAKALMLAQNYLLKAMFLNPIPHINNEGMHWIVERGKEWVTPQGTLSLWTTGNRARESVLKQDALQREMLRNGATTFMPDIMNKEYYAGRLEEQKKALNPSDPNLINLAKSIGMTPVDFISTWAKMSNHVMWTARDMMYTQAVLEHLGKTKPEWSKMSEEERAPLMQQSIKEVEKHMPSYRIPNRVLGRRGIANIMKNPVLTQFSYYHYGVARSFVEFGKSSGELGKGLVLGPEHIGKSAKELVQASTTLLGQLAVMGLVYSQLYPAMDKGMSWLLNRAVTARRAGGFALIESVQKLATENSIDAESLIRSLISPSSATADALSMFLNRDIITGQPIHQKADPVGRQVEDAGLYMATRFAPAQMMQQASTRDHSIGQVLTDQLADVKEKSTKKAYFNYNNYLKVLKGRLLKGEKVSPAEWAQLSKLQKEMANK